MMNFSPSLDKFKTIPFDKYANDFTFIVNGRRYETNRVIADLLSPIICQYHYQDETIDDFSINISIDKQENSQYEDYFLDFLNLYKFEHVLLDSTRQKYYLEYFRLLGNDTEFFNLQSSFFENITIDNVIDRLLFIQEMNKSFTNIDKIDDLISFASQHFEQIDQTKLKKLNIDILEEIIQNESLKLDGEETLLQFIVDLYENDRNYSNLFEYIIFTNLKEETFESFITSFDINDLNESIWKSICQRLLSNQSHSLKKTTTRNNQKRYHKEIQTFEYSKRKEFEGIIQYLTRKTGGNIHYNGTIEITSNSIYGMNNLPPFVVDYLKDNSYYSKDEGDAKICFDFKNMKVQLSSYSIKSGNNAKGGSHLRNWIIEGSNDNENWDLIDFHKNDSTLNGPLIVSNFDVSRNKDMFYRYIQLRQTGNSWYSYGQHNSICFRMIEFFGKILLK